MYGRTGRRFGVRRAAFGLEAGELPAGLDQMFLERGLEHDEVVVRLEVELAIARIAGECECRGIRLARAMDLDALVAASKHPDVVHAYSIGIGRVPLQSV